ncbi:MAG: hypothetical protein QM817_05475 [Archangium sp.]
MRELVLECLGRSLLPFAYDHTYRRELGEPIGILFAGPVRITFGTLSVLLEVVRDEDERHWIPWADFEIATALDTVLVGSRALQLAIEVDDQAREGLLRLHAARCSK